MFIKQLLQLNEARVKSLTYSEKEVKGVVERVIVELKGNESGKMTKLAKRFQELEDEIEALENAKKKLSVEIKQNVTEMFDATDVVYTRVVETAKVSITLSKQEEAGKKINYEKVVQMLVTMVPELTAKVEQIKEACTTEVKAREPSLRVKVDEGFKEIWLKIKSSAKAMLLKFNVWAKRYDAKLDDVKSLM